MMKVLLIWIIFILLPFNIGCTEQEGLRREELSRQEEFETAPDFTLEDIDGEELTLSEFKGKVIILNFFATWCPPCQMKIPGFIELYNRYNSQGLEIIGVSLDRGSDIVTSFVKDKEINYPILMAAEKKAEITKDYGGIRGVPTTFIIDQRMKIRSKHIGYRPIETFEEEIKRLLPSSPQ